MFVLVCYRDIPDVNDVRDADVNFRNHCAVLIKW